jgi:hypothetical protein
VLTVEFTVPGHSLSRSQRRPGVQAYRGLFLPDRDGESGRDGPLLERDRRQRRHGKPVRLVQGPAGPLLADHPVRGTDALAANGGEAKRAFEPMRTMKKIDIAAIETARRG